MRASTPGSAGPTVPGRRGPRGLRGNVDTLTEALGVTADELRDARQAGESIADVAEAQGVDVDTVVAAIVSDIEEHLGASRGGCVFAHRLQRFAVTDDGLGFHASVSVVEKRAPPYLLGTSLKTSPTRRLNFALSASR